MATSTRPADRDVNESLILSNLERGTHAMTLIGGGFVSTGDEALLCAFAMHPFDHHPGVQRRLVRRVWRRARTHGQASRFATGEALVRLAAEAVAEYHRLAADVREFEYMDLCAEVFANALFDGDVVAASLILDRENLGRGKSSRSVTSPTVPDVRPQLLVPTA